MLLRIARATLLEEVLPLAAPAQRYTIRMIARAIELGCRELAADGAGGEREAKQRVQDAYTGSGLPGPPDDVSRREAEWRFALDLRAGRFDAHAALVVPLLKEGVHARLALANPKLLRGEGAEAPAERMA